MKTFISKSTIQIRHLNKQPNILKNKILLQIEKNP